MTERHNTYPYLIGCSRAVLNAHSGSLPSWVWFEIFQDKKIINANKFICLQALKIKLFLKIYFMFSDYI